MFKIGSTVRIKPYDELYDSNGRFHFNPKMQQYCGGTYKVIEVRGYTIRLMLPDCSHNWVWDTRWLVLIDKTPNGNIFVGDDL